MALIVAYAEATEIDKLIPKQFPALSYPLKERIIVMEFGVISKVLFFAVWPFLILLIVYLLDRKKFKARWEKLKQTGFFSK